MPRTVILVCGPPCAGKSSYVAARADLFDVVLNQDVLGSKVMEQRLAGLARFHDGTAWVIRCTPGPTRREELARRIGATRVVLLVPTHQELRRRAKQRVDTRRTMAAIAKWFDDEAKDAGRPRIAGRMTSRAW